MLGVHVCISPNARTFDVKEAGGTDPPDVVEERRGGFVIKWVVEVIDVYACEHHTLRLEQRFQQADAAPDAVQARGQWPRWHAV